MRYRSILIVAILGTISAATAVTAQDAKEPNDMNDAARAFLADYLATIQPMSKAAALAGWKASNTGEKADFDRAAELSLEIRKLHSDPETFEKIKRLRAGADALSPVEARSLEQAERSFKANQLPLELLEKMVKLSSDTELIRNTFRAKLGGEEYTNNELLEMLGKENDTMRRRAIWTALKDVGAALAPNLVELAKLRNEAARTLGYDNYWEMSIDLQEHDADQLIALFDELDRLTLEPFRQMKDDMDGELAERFDTSPEKLMPWHYDNPFFQAAPPSDEVDLDVFYADKTKEDVVEISRRYYADLGLPVEDILARSDLYEREGKDQHAFCTSIDGEGDVRILCNIKPTARWMDTQLHELGHAVYDVGVDRALPFNIRGPAHALTTEGVAMLFGALGGNPEWMTVYADADPDQVAELEDAILEQRRREQLIFARWTMVMLHFERALYEDPEQDLNTLWWDLVERYQLLTRPADRDEPDWASKPHFVSAPVYYHNYMMGELFAAQVRNAVESKLQDADDLATAKGEDLKRVGAYLTKEVFEPGDRQPWNEMIERATGEPLTAKYFATEVTK